MKKFLIPLVVALAAAPGLRAQEQPAEDVDALLLKEYRPISVFNIPATRVERARYPAIDMHSHNYARSEAEVERWVQQMDAAGIRLTMIMNNASAGPFELLAQRYRKYPDRFMLWCSFDYTDCDKPGWSEKAVAALERYHALGCKGVGEVGDKGVGDLYANPVKGAGMHIDDERMRPLLKRCGELGMPVSMHVADPIWMYLPIDRRNDGLMNAAKWRVDTTVQGCLGYEGLMRSFERAVAANPGTVFIACHYLNMTHDLPRLASLLDRYPNLYIDIAARLSEAAATPRATRQFIIRYADRILFGTDNGMGVEMYRSVFRILESADEHIITPSNSYYWPLSGLYLPDDVLRKIYYENAEKLLGLKR